MSNCNFRFSAVRSLAPTSLDDASNPALSLPSQSSGDAVAFAASRSAVSVSLSAVIALTASVAFLASSFNCGNAARTSSGWIAVLWSISRNDVSTELPPPASDLTTSVARIRIVSAAERFRAARTLSFAGSAAASLSSRSATSKALLPTDSCTTRITSSADRPASFASFPRATAFFATPNTRTPSARLPKMERKSPTTSNVAAVAATPSTNAPLLAPSAEVKSVLSIACFSRGTFSASSDTRSTALVLWRNVLYQSTSPPKLCRRSCPPAAPGRPRSAKAWLTNPCVRTAPPPGTVSTSGNRMSFVVPQYVRSLAGTKSRS